MKSKFRFSFFGKEETLPQSLTEMKIARLKDRVTSKIVAGGGAWHVKFCQDHAGGFAKSVDCNRRIVTKITS